MQTSQMDENTQMKNFFLFQADLVEDILSLEAGEPSSRDLSDILSDLKCGNSDASLPGINYPPGVDLPEKSSSFPGEPYSPDDHVRQAKDRQKKDNHNMSACCVEQTFSSYVI